MKILLSPTKKMRADPDSLRWTALPQLLPQTELLLRWLQSQSAQALQGLWNCNDTIAAQNLERIRQMDLRQGLSPAICSYEGLAFQHMAPTVFTDSELSYVQAHLRILSGFYGILRPLDGITPYRLEMQAKAAVGGHPDLYSFWGRSLYDLLEPEDGVLLDLASQEYSKAIRPYLRPSDRFVTCTFCESVNGVLRQKGTFSKMARGEMVRYLAQIQAQSPEAATGFSALGYRFREELSTDTQLIFERSPA